MFRSSDELSLSPEVAKAARDIRRNWSPDEHHMRRALAVVRRWNLPLREFKADQNNRDRRVAFH